MNTRTISAAWLRERHPENGVIPLSASLAPMLADALEIADYSARSDIETFLRRTQARPAWYDIRTADQEEKGYVENAVRYLTARGLLERDEKQPHLVHVLDEPKVGA